MEHPDPVPRPSPDAPVSPSNGECAPSPLVARVWRVAHGLTFSDLEARTGVNHETVRRYLRSGKLSLKFIVAFCKSFDVSAEWLVTGEGPMRRTDVRRALAAARAGARVVRMGVRRNGRVVGRGCRGAPVRGTGAPRRKRRSTR